MLTPTDIESYQRDGFIVVRQLFSREEIDRLREATDRQIEKSRQSIWIYWPAEFRLIARRAKTDVFWWCREATGSLL